MACILQWSAVRPFICRPSCKQSHAGRCIYRCAEVPLLKDRDFVYREVTQQLPGGVHIIFGQSITAEEEAQCADVPRPASVIRGEMGASGDALTTR